MLKWIRKVLRYGARRLNQEQEPETPIFKDLARNRKFLEGVFHHSPDLKFRPIRLGSGQHALLVHLDNMVDRSSFQEFIVNPLQEKLKPGQSLSLDVLGYEVVSSCTVRHVTTLEEGMRDLLDSGVLLLVEGITPALSFHVPGMEARGIEESKTEAAVRGPRDAFVENIAINVTQLRRRIKDPDLVVEFKRLGLRSNTKVAVVYIKGVAPDDVVAEVNRRLQRIQIDGILESGNIEELIEDTPFSPFATIANSERPDKVAAKLLEGRVAILTDGTPFVLTVPTLFVEYFQAAEDYYSRPYYVSLVRLLRYLSAAITVYLPAVFVMLVAYHKELIPTPLLMTMASAREGIPFPVVLEALMMGFIFEILREAGVRLPRPIGQAVSIVGALVLGEAAVQAGLISPAMVIVTSLTAITSFVTPPLIDVLTLLRFLSLLFAGTLGAFGLLWLSLIMLVHAASLRSFGVPFLTPLAPGKTGEWGDTFLRMPLWARDRRPRTLAPHNDRRAGQGQMPRVPKKGLGAWLGPKKGKGGGKDGQH